MPPPRLGPTLKATIATPDLDRSMAAWCGNLHQHVHGQGTVDEVRAAQLRIPGLSGARQALLANELEEPWLEFIECPGAPVANPFDHPGWFSLEISVQNVDKLRQELDGFSFQVIGEPANLDVSDKIRAMQLLGPSGEVLYLTQVDAPVPPFQLPYARCSVDRLFIAVLLTNERDPTLAFYENLCGASGLKFETRITVINRARGLDPGLRHPVAALQLAGSNLIEIDQLENLSLRAQSERGLPAGIASISFAVETLPPELDHYFITANPYAGRKAALTQGASGEWIELVETDLRE